MKILWIKSEHPLPLYTGHRKRTYNLMEQLSRISPVTFLSYVNVRDDESPMAVDLPLQAAGVVSKEIGLHRRHETRSGAGFYLRLLSQVGSSTPYFIRRNLE